ncbi:DUF5131 family protein [Haloferula sp. A504]|uniref:DUF5131 family protein n=1 Tax=Haloferula sp. A504 TaxID=3373601 RepID=UPI0031BC54CA|nr:phage Gp37/Gp68 family protein [Verrucomicrobiaceae bacterium E54]
MNPIVGCDGCELWPHPSEIIPGLVSGIGQRISMHADELRTRVERVLASYQTGTSILHARYQIIDRLNEEFPKIHYSWFERWILEPFRCFAGVKIADHDSRFVASNATGDKERLPIFENVTPMPGRMENASLWSDLRGQARGGKPWLSNLSRTILISSMGDALSEAIPFSFLSEEIIHNVDSEPGSRHNWIWMTKRPSRMADFAAWLRTEHGKLWPGNLMSMTSVTNQATAYLVDELRNVPGFKAVCFEPLVEKVVVDLTGIDWVVVGGESGEYARPFNLDWVRSLQTQCRILRIPFFIQGLGARQIDDGRELRLGGGRIGYWGRWPDEMRVREMPYIFRRPGEVETEVAV